MFQERNQIFNFLHRPLRSSSPLHHVLVSSSSTVLPDVQGVVGERVLGLVIVVGSQQRSRPDAHIVRRQRPTKLGRQTLGMDELVERVQVVAVEEDLRRVSRGEVNLVTSDISARITGAGTPAHPLPGLVFEERLDDGVHGVNVPGLIHKMDSSEASRETVLRKGEQSRSFHIVFNVNLADREEDGGGATWRPSMASLRMLGVSLDACLKEKLLQSMMRMKPLICSSGFSIRTSRESRMARRMSVKEFLSEGGVGVNQQLIDGCAERDGPLTTAPSSILVGAVTHDSPLCVLDQCGDG